jgi:hypothetical protein
VSSTLRDAVLNDLDLRITRVGARGRVYFPNGRASPDPTNNVEKARPLRPSTSL